MGAVDEPPVRPLGEGFEERQLEVIVPVVDGAPAWDVDGHHTQRFRRVDAAADHPRLSIEVLVAQVARGSHVADRMPCRHRHAVVGATPTCTAE